MESRNSGFLCLDQGLGKTACAILYINRRKNTRNIIIVPPVAIYVWLSEFQKWAPGEDVTAVTTTAQLKKFIDGFTGNLVLSYDVFKVNRQAIVQSGEWGCVICDESHYLKERSAQRTKAVWSLLSHVSSCFFLTGTPIPNRHIELWAPLRMLNIIKMDYTTYGLKFCGAWCMPNGYWNYGGSTNAPELKNILAPVMFRCTKDEVLKELPPRQLIVVSLDMPIHRQEKSFDKKELDKYEGEIVLPKLQELLIEQAHKKLPKVIIFIRDLLAHEPKVVIFAEHRAIIEALVAEFKDMKAVLVYGGITPKGRAAAIETFQTNPECRVFVGQSIAAGISTTLTAASAVVFAESPWSWGTVTQCIDRTHRIGQRGFVKAYFMTVAKSIDEYVIKRLIEKHEVVERVVCSTGEIEEVEEERNLMEKEVLIELLSGIGEVFSKVAKGLAGEVPAKPEPPKVIKVSAPTEKKAEASKAVLLTKAAEGTDPDFRCVACQGSGKNSKGGECKPCKGTGVDWAKLHGDAVEKASTVVAEEVIHMEAVRKAMMELHTANPEAIALLKEEFGFKKLVEVPESTLKPLMGRIKEELNG